MLSLLSAALAASPPDGTGPMISMNATERAEDVDARRADDSDFRHVELGLRASAMPSDPLMRTGALTGGLSLHFDDVLGLDLQLGRVWEREDARLPQRTVDPLIEVAPRESSLIACGHVALMYTPIHGDAWFMGRPSRIAAFAYSGVGGAFSEDDTTVYGRYDPEAEDVREIHPTSVFGAGLLATAGPSFALRADLTQMVYIEQIHETTLEIRRWWSWSMGVSFFPGG